MKQYAANSALIGVRLFLLYLSGSVHVFDVKPAASAGAPAFSIESVLV